MYRNLLNGFRPMYHLRIRAQLKGQGIPVPTTDRYKRDKGYFCSTGGDIILTSTVVDVPYIRTMKQLYDRGNLQWSDTASDVVKYL